MQMEDRVLALGVSSQTLQGRSAPIYAAYCEASPHTKMSPCLILCYASGGEKWGCPPTHAHRQRWKAGKREKV